MILAQAAQLFSRQGYFGSSLSDIMHETGLEKGGIYNHFNSKEQLALEAFDYAVVDGGCPILNTAVEADDAYPVLRDRARAAMDSLRGTLERIITKGIERQEIRAEVDVDTCVTVFIATAEGAVMLSKLYQDPVHMRRAAAHLTRYIETDLRA